MQSYLIGVILITIGTFSNALGTRLIPTRPRLGNFLSIGIGEILGVVAMQLAPLSTLAPLGALVIAWTIVINLVETTPPASLVRRYVIYGTATTMGCATVVAFGPKHVEAFTMVDKSTHLIVLFTSGTFISIVSFGALIFNGSVSGEGNGSEGERFAARVSLERNPSVTAVIAGIMGGFTQSCAKSTQRAYVERHPSFLTMTFLTIGFGLYQWFLVNTAIECAAHEGGSLKINPIYIFTLIVSVVTVSGLTFDEFSNTTPREEAAFALGIALAAFGVWKLNEIQRLRMMRRHGVPAIPPRTQNPPPPLTPKKSSGTRRIVPVVASPLPVVNRINAPVTNVGVC